MDGLRPNARGTRQNNGFKTSRNGGAGYGKQMAFPVDQPIGAHLARGFRMGEVPPNAPGGRSGTGASGELAILDLAQRFAHQGASFKGVAQFGRPQAPQRGNRGGARAGDILLDVGCRYAPGGRGRAQSGEIKSWRLPIETSALLDFLDFDFHFGEKILQAPVYPVGKEQAECNHAQYPQPEADEEILEKIAGENDLASNTLSFGHGLVSSCLPGHEWMPRLVLPSACCGPSLYPRSLRRVFKPSSLQASNTPLFEPILHMPRLLSQSFVYLFF